MIKTIRHRFLTILILSFVFSYGLLGYLVIERQAQIDRERMLSSSRRTANIISKILRESMMEGDPGFTQMTLGMLRREDADNNIFVLGQKKFGEPDFPINRRTLEEMSGSGQPFSEIRNDRFYFYMPLVNEESCAKCHAEKGLIGVIVVDRSIAAQRAEVRHTSVRLIAYGLFIMLIGLALFSRITAFYIIRPLSMINETIHSYSKQDFSKRIPIAKLKGEFSVIGNTVNSMAERLSSLYELLEQKIHKQNIELKGQLDFVEMLINSINSGIMLVDNNGVVLKANPYTTKVLEADEKSIIGKHVDTFIEGFYGEIARNVSGESPFKLKTGKIAHIGYSVSEVGGVADLQGKVVLFRDLTEVVVLRSQLKRKEYFSTIGEMASWIAHEIKNPIFGMSSSAEILLKTSDEDSKGFLDAIIRECNRLNRLIDDLLQYAKPVELKLSEADLREIAEEVVTLLGSAASAGNCRLVLDGNNGVPKVKGDKDKIKQVFFNIVNNSIEANATLVDIGFDNDDYKVAVRIRDDGTGIDKRTIENVFKPFFTTKKKGTGLGLAICKKIVEEHGGSMALNSGDGGGTSVDVIFQR